MLPVAGVTFTDETVGSTSMSSVQLAVTVTFWLGMMKVVEPAFKFENVPAPDGDTVHPAKVYPVRIPASIGIVAPGTWEVVPDTVPLEPVPEIVRSKVKIASIQLATRLIGSFIIWKLAVVALVGLFNVTLNAAGDVVHTSNTNPTGATPGLSVTISPCAAGLGFALAPAPP